MPHEVPPVGELAPKDQLTGFDVAPLVAPAVVIRE